MKIPAVVAALFLSIATANASALHDSHLALAARHASLAHRAPTPLEKKVITSRARRRCKKKSTSTSVAPAAASSSSAPSVAKNTDTSDHTSKKNEAPSPTPSATPKAVTKTNNNNDNGGTIQVSGNCGGSRATSQTTTVSGPNGHIDWLNCGLNAGGWTPPFIRVQDLVTKSLSGALANPSSPFKACASFIGLFEKYGNEYGLPAIMLASFAMQESSCNPNTVGGGGEQGLMQITREKCGGAPGGNCKDPEFNIRTGARYFADTLRGNNGDVLVSIGQYNGWSRGLTYAKATAAAHSGCCRCQNNVDYLHQFVNGWLQNINAYDNNFRLGKYFNLDVCN